MVAPLPTCTPNCRKPQRIAPRHQMRYTEPLTLDPGTVVVVTGAGSGMGRELSLLCARRGCWVAGCDVNEGPLAETVGLMCAVALDASYFAVFGGIFCPISCKIKRIWGDM